MYIILRMHDILLTGKLIGKLLLCQLILLNKEKPGTGLKTKYLLIMTVLTAVVGPKCKLRI
jgi:hypothetical protein